MGASSFQDTGRIFYGSSMKTDLVRAFQSMTEDELGHWILAQIKKRETTKQKLQSAEISIIALCEVIKSIMSIVRETTKKINKAKDLVARLDTVIPLIEQRMS